LTTALLAASRSTLRIVQAAALVAAILLPLATAVRTVSAGPFTSNGSQPPLTFGISTSTSCRGCHGFDYDAANNIEPWDTWAGSMMAQAARDPLFWAALDVANNDAPDVGDFCLRCHVPRGWLAGRSEPPGGSTNGCGLSGKIDQASNDFDGVTCHFCHRMMVNVSPPPGQLPVYFENAQFWVDDTTCAGFSEPCRRGPYDHPADGTAPPPHAWLYSAYHEESRLCGNCHNVTSPVETLIDGGIDTGVPFPIERTFREWQQSAYGDTLSGDFATCQGCHMPDAQANPAYACNAAANNHSGDMPIHQLAGGNAWIPDVLRQEYPALGLSAQFIATQNWALDMLQNQSATIEVAVPDTLAPENLLTASVRVTNLTGHKLPTGYPEGRRMWINVRARDGFGALIWESGAYDSTTGALAADAQLRVYHAEQGIWDHNSTNTCDCEDTTGSPMFHFVLNNCIKTDNRIPPKGFTGMNDPETRPVGATYPETFAGSGVLVNYDVASYTIYVPPGTPPPVTVTATLRYQTASDEYVTFLRDEAVANGFPDDCIERTTGFPTKSRGEILYDMWTARGKCPPVDMATASDASAIGATKVRPVTAPLAVRLSPASGPAEATQRIRYELPERGAVTLSVFDVSGRVVARLVDAPRPAGAHEAEWNASAHASGVYFYRLETAGTVRTAKVLLVR
jgi:hypothetical protein